MMSMDALSGAISYVQAEWGHSDDGYYVEQAENFGRHGVRLSIVHNDGSRFQVACNRYGVPLDPMTGAEYHCDGGHWSP